MSWTTLCQSWRIKSPFQVSMLRLRSVVIQTSVFLGQKKSWFKLVMTTHQAVCFVFFFKWDCYSSEKFGVVRAPWVRHGVFGRLSSPPFLFGFFKSFFRCEAGKLSWRIIPLTNHGYHESKSWNDGLPGLGVYKAFVFTAQIEKSFQKVDEER